LFCEQLAFLVWNWFLELLHSLHSLHWEVKLASIIPWHLSRGSRRGFLLIPILKIPPFVIHTGPDSNIHGIVFAGESLRRARGFDSCKMEIIREYPEAERESKA